MIEAVLNERILTVLSHTLVALGEITAILSYTVFPASCPVTPSVQTDRRPVSLTLSHDRLGGCGVTSRKIPVHVFIAITSAQSECACFFIGAFSVCSTHNHFLLRSLSPSATYPRHHCPVQLNWGYIL